MDIRTCCVCREVIAECMGFVLARDILALFESPSIPGRTPTQKIHEICGKCGMRALYFDSDEIEKLIASIA